MPTDVTFLKNLEQDLTRIAEGEKRFARSAVRASRRSRWGGWSAAAAMLLVVAFAIGATQFFGTAASNEFSTVGSAVNGVGGGGGAPVPGTRADVPGLQSGSGTSAPLASPTAVSGSGSKTDLTKIVRDGSISLSIDRGQFQGAAAKIVSIADQNDGSILSSTTSQSNSGTFTLRIPAANFDRAMVQLA